MNLPIIESWLEANQPHAAEKLSVSLGVSMSTIRTMRKGTAPTWDVMKRLAQVLGVTLDDLACAPKNKKGNR